MYALSGILSDLLSNINVFDLFETDTTEESSQSDTSQRTEEIANKVNQVVVRGQCPYFTSGKDWGINTILYAAMGSLDFLTYKVQIPETQSFHPMCWLSFGHKRQLLFVTDPEVMEMVLKEYRDGEKYCRGAEHSALAKFATGNRSVLTEQDEKEHNRVKSFALRKDFGENCIRKRIPEIGTITANHIKSLQDSINESQGFNITEKIPSYPLKCMTEIILGISDEFPELITAIAKSEQAVSDRILLNPKTFVPTAFDQDYKESMTALEEATNKILVRSKEDSCEGLIAKMIKDGTFSEEQQIDMIRTCLVIGSGTTKSAITSAIYCLLKNPEWQTKLYEELLPIKESLSEEATAEAYQELMKNCILDNILEEVFRLCPPIMVQARTAKQDLILGDVNVPQETTIFLSNIHSNRDEKHFKDPLKFDPDRYNRKEDTGKTHIFSYGHSMCLGRFFAPPVVKLDIFELVTQFKILPPLDEAGREIDQALKPVGGMTWKFNEPLKVRLVRRPEE